MLAVAARLLSDGVAFALITVVRATRPTSGKPGDKAILTERGDWLGWVGGSCAEPTARRAAKQALADGVCRLIHITNDETEAVRPGVEVAAMTCHSGGSLEIYVEPHLPRPSLVVFGGSPIAHALCELGALMQYRVISADLAGGEATGATVAAARSDIERVAVISALGHLPPGRGIVVVASHGRHELEAIGWALRAGAAYVGLVTSGRRLPDVLERLRARGFTNAELAQLRAPAGLPIGASRPEEVALSILAEVVAVRHAAAGSETESRLASASESELESESASASGSETEPESESESESKSESKPESASAMAMAGMPQPSAAVRRSCCDVEEPATEAGAARSLTASLRVSAVVLAAGLSRRMGAHNKLLLPIDGKPMVARVLETVLAAGFSEVIVVVGHEADAVRGALAPLGVRCVFNERYDSGQVSSVRAGLAALEHHADAVMICLGDQPLLRSSDLQALVSAYARRPSGSIVIPTRGGQRGNPVIIDWQSARDTLERGVNFGCRHFIEEHPERVYRWPAPSDNFVRDVDDPGDYERVLGGSSVDAAKTVDS